MLYVFTQGFFTQIFHYKLTISKFLKSYQVVMASIKMIYFSMFTKVNIIDISITNYKNLVPLESIEYKYCFIQIRLANFALSVITD